MSIRLLHAMIDVISSSGWLSCALAAMELCQMITQGLWDRDSVFLQIPHFTKELAEKCHNSNLDSIFELMELEDDERKKILGFSNLNQLADVARWCNRYPNIECTFQIENKDDIHAGSSVREI